MLQVLTMKLTESSNICCTSNRIAFTIKGNKKDTFMGNDGFVKRWFPASVYVVNGLQPENKRPITSIIWYLMREGQISTTLSPLWENLQPMLSKIDVIKFFNPSLLHI